MHRISVGIGEMSGIFYKLYRNSCNLSNGANRMKRQYCNLGSPPMRVLIVSFDFVRPKDPNTSLASASIITYLENTLPSIDHNIDVFHKRVNVADNTVLEVTDELISAIKDIEPRVIGTGVYVWNETYVSHMFLTLSEEIVSNKAIVILGGPQITYGFRGSLERLYPFAQIFIRGYAEQSLLKTLIGINSSTKPYIKGVHYFGDRDESEMSELDLKSLPSPLLSGQTKHSGYIRMESKRGCAFKCRFCQHRDSYGQRDEYDLNRIEREVQWIVDQKISDISFVDPIFNIPNSNHIKILDYFGSYGFKGRLNLQTRLEMIDQNFIHSCSQLMDRGIKIELECGLQTINKEEMIIIDRPQSLRKIEKISQQLVSNQIPFEVSLIYGLPMQTVDSFRKTIEFVDQKMRPNRVRAWPLMLLKGTKMFDMKDKYKLREKLLDSNLEPTDNMRQYSAIPHVVSSSTFSEEEWIVMKIMAEQLNKKDNFSCE